MTTPPTNYEVRPFPLSRRLVIDACEWGKRKHMVHALVEMDVTRARQLIREHKAQTGEALSLTAFFAHAVAKAVAEDRIYHGGSRSVSGPPTAISDGACLSVANELN